MYSVPFLISHPDKYTGSCCEICLVSLSRAKLSSTQQHWLSRNEVQQSKEKKIIGKCFYLKALGTKPGVTKIVFRVNDIPTIKELNCLRSTYPEEYATDNRQTHWFY